MSLRVDEEADEGVSVRERSAFRVPGATAVADDAVADDSVSRGDWSSVVVEKLVGNWSVVICAPALLAKIAASLLGPVPRYGSA